MMINYTIFSCTEWSISNVVTMYYHEKDDVQTVEGLPGTSADLHVQERFSM